MARIEREALLERFRAMIQSGQPIVGGGAGTGLSAKCEEAGGIDLIVIYNSGRYRMAGRGSLAGLMAYGNANQIVLEMAREVLPVVQHTPVLAGVCGTDPFCIFEIFSAVEGARLLRHPELSDGRTDRRDLPRQPRRDRHGLRPGGRPGRKARALDLLTTPYVFCAEEARAMTEAGADIVVAHMGLTMGGSIGAETAAGLDDCVPRIEAIAKAARVVRDDVIVLCHGGPIATPRTPPTSWRAAPTATASTAPAPWSACRPRSRSPSRPAASRRSAAKRSEEASPDFSRGSGAPPRRWRRRCSAAARDDPKGAQEPDCGRAKRARYG